MYGAPLYAPYLCWIACLHSRGVVVVETSPTIIKEYDYDEEFRRLGYTASLVGGSKSAVEELKSIARKASSMHVRKPGLRQCGASVVTSVLRPKFVDPLAFAKVPAAEVAAVESGYGSMLRSFMSVAQGFPWDVLAWSAECEGLGASRLTTEVAKTRLRMFQAMAVSMLTSENDMARAITMCTGR